MLVITWNFRPRRGGIEYLISHICAGFKRRRSVAVVTAHVHAPGAPETGVFRAPWPGLIAFGCYALWRGALLLFRDPGKKVVFGGSALVTPLVVILARLFGCTAVVQIHGLDIIYANPVYQFLCVRWLQRCDHVIANSTHTALLAKDAGVPANRVTVIPPGVDLRRFASPVTDFSESGLDLEGRSIVLFVGRLARRKGVKEFIQRSWVNVVREIPQACFVIAGDNPVESLTHRHDVHGEIQAAVAQLQLQDHVRLLGGVSDEQLVALYQTADVVVLPALAEKNDIEGFGVVLLEAAAAGTPTVATRVGGIPDAVDHGKGGILISAGDYDEMTRALIMLMSDDDLRTRLGRYGSSWVQEKFAWDKIIACYERTLGLERT